MWRSSSLLFFATFSATAFACARVCCSLLSPLWLFVPVFLATRFVGVCLPSLLCIWVAGCYPVCWYFNYALAVHLARWVLWCKCWPLWRPIFRRACSISRCTYLCFSLFLGFGVLAAGVLIVSASHPRPRCPRSCLLCFFAFSRFFPRVLRSFSLLLGCHSLAVRWLVFLPLSSTRITHCLFHPAFRRRPTLLVGVSVGLSFPPSSSFSPPFSLSWPFFFVSSVLQVPALSPLRPSLLLTSSYA